MRILDSRRFFVAVVGPAALVLIAGCGKDGPPPAPPEVVRPIRMYTVGEGPGSESGPRTFPGRVKASQQVDLSFRVGGPLVEFPVNEGDRVRKGQLLARIDPRDYRIRIESTQAQFDKAAADFERLAALYEKAAISKAQLDQARASRDVAKAALDDAEANLSDTELRAPFEGRVGATFVENFTDVVPREPILSLVGLAELEIEVDLPESIVARIRDDRPDELEIWAQFDVSGDRKFPLRLTELANQADPTTQTYRATARMRRPDGVNILPGMTAQVTGRRPPQPDEDTGVIVPAKAVVADESGTAHVWVVDTQSMTVHRRDVRTGELVGSDAIRVMDGLDAGETIATSAVSRLREAMQVRRLES